MNDRHPPVSNVSHDKLTQFALDELSEPECEAVEQQLAANNDARHKVGELRQLADCLKQANGEASLPDLSSELRRAVNQRLTELDANKTVQSKGSCWRRITPSRRLAFATVAISLCLLILITPIVQTYRVHREAARRTQCNNNLRQIGLAMHGYNDTYGEIAIGSLPATILDRPVANGQGHWQEGTKGGRFVKLLPYMDRQAMFGKIRRYDNNDIAYSYGFQSNHNGRGANALLGDGTGFRHKSVDDFIPDSMYTPTTSGRQFIPSAYGATYADVSAHEAISPVESYVAIVENAFLKVDREDAISTFSIDVDTASYSNSRRYLNNGQIPPPQAVRVEEFVNYFRYDYPQPQAGEPFSVNMEVAQCPWQSKHQLLRVGLKGREIEPENRPAANLVFLIDVSGSMEQPNKLPLLKRSMKLLVDQLDDRDRVTIVTYAGEAGLQLPASSDKRKIKAVINGLGAGGSTHGSAGIHMAYEQAAKSFMNEGTNRVILATDGDLNVGVTGDEELVELIKEKAASGVFLTVLGFGTGNLKDHKLESLADNGNGMYAYIDQLKEGRRVLVRQITSSLVTIAKDVKIQIEFNPATIAAYRLIGYENRLLATEDFDDDTKDAGEIGAGHTVTALYELVPVDGGYASGEARQVELSRPLKYQKMTAKIVNETRLTAAAESDELLTLALRYKQPDSDESQRIEYALKDSAARFSESSGDFQFASAVAAFAMLLRDSKYRGNTTCASVEEIAASSLGKDPHGDRAEFLELVRRAEQLGK